MTITKTADAAISINRACKLPFGTLLLLIAKTADFAISAHLPSTILVASTSSFNIQLLARVWPAPQYIAQEAVSTKQYGNIITAINPTCPSARNFDNLSREIHPLSTNDFGLTLKSYTWPPSCPTQFKSV
ncbi:hypothetical protein D9757_011932 [Collybiopsis confluens]|uniref:Uncharacterized protein n=1 Tax=Collybiopsis confluens TaxID=2823264 RepID=A0A8H5LRJ6_9AGAR|nr:hypothetical protein D9757_011932 [Collybiopsis confluens]